MPLNILFTIVEVLLVLVFLGTFFVYVANVTKPAKGKTARRNIRMLTVTCALMLIGTAALGLFVAWLKIKVEKQQIESLENVHYKEKQADSTVVPLALTEPDHE